MDQKKLKRLIYDKSQKIGDREFFTSRLLASSFEEKAAAITRRYRSSRRIRVRLLWEPKIGTVAYTDNNSVVINCANHILNDAVREPRYKMVLGLFAHELGHILYTDFFSLNSFQNFMKKGRWYPEIPVAGNPDEAAAIREIEETLRDEMYRFSLIRLIDELDNIMEDGYIEERIITRFPGSLGHGLNFLRSRHREQMPNVTEMIQKEEAGDSHIFLTLEQMILEYVKYGTISYGETERSDERIQTMYALLPLLDERLEETNGRNRIAITNKVAIFLWKHIKSFLEFVKDKQEESNPSGSGSGTGTGASGSGKSLEDLLSELAKENLTGTSEEGKGTSSPVADGDKDDEPKTKSSSEKARKKTAKEAEKSKERSSSEKEKSKTGKGGKKNSGSDSSSKKKESSESGKGSENGSATGEDEEEEGKGKSETGGSEEGEDSGSASKSAGSGEEDDSGSASKSAGSGEEDESGSASKSAGSGEEDESGSASESAESGEEDESGSASESAESGEEDESGEGSESEGKSTGSSEESSSGSKKSGVGSGRGASESEDAIEPGDHDAPDGEMFDEVEGDGEEEYDSDYEEDFDSKSASEISSLLEEMAERDVLESLEKETEADLNRFSSDIDYGPMHRGINVHVHREAVVNDEKVSAYQECAAPLLAISKKLQKSVKQKIKDVQLGGKQTGLLMGRRIESRNLHRNDGKVFYKNNLPQDIPRLAIGVLVDESGSMRSNGRDVSARAAAIILYDFCLALGIPVCIYGHSTEYRHVSEDVAIYSYAEFDSVDKKDAYRLMSIHARSNNRDAVPLRFVAERLCKRPEEEKILILISDGQPAANGYYGSGPCEELAKIKKDYNHKHIGFVAAAIGDDKEQIEKIYGDSFLDITDLNSLPVKLTNIIKKHIRV